MDWTDVVTRILADWLIVVIIGISLFMLAGLPRKKLPHALVLAFMVLAIGYIIERVLSLLYIGGERPYIEMGVAPGAWAPDNPGFPSSHTFFAFAFTLIVWASTHDKTITLLLVGLSCLVAVGRVVALVHTPLDVVVGALVAGFAAWVVYREHLFKRS